MACTQSDYAGAFKFDTDKLFVFERPFSAADDVDSKSQSINQAISGKVEILNYFDRYAIPLSRNWITGTEYTGLRRWYESVRDGSSFEFWKDYKLVNYWPFSDSINSSDGTVSGITTVLNRSGDTATVVNPDTGFIETVLADTPRFIEGPFSGSRGILIEKSSTNELTYSNDPNNAAWTKSGVTIANDKYYSPDGTKNADVIEASVDGVDGYIQQTVSGVLTGDYTLSFYARSQGTGYDITLSCPELAESTTCTLTSEWQRFSLTVETSLSATLTFRITTDKSKGPVVYGMQFESGKYATSYIPTSGATATRNQETLNTDLNEHFNGNVFSLSSWVYHNFAEDGAQYDFFSGVNGSVTVLEIKKNTLDLFGITTSDEYGDTTFITTKNVTFTAGWHYYTFVFDSENNEFRMYADGAQAGTTDTYNLIMPDIETFYFGNNGDNYKSVMAFHGTTVENRALTLAEHAARYNDNYAAGIGKNYFPAVRLKNPAYQPIKVLGGNRWNFETELEEVL